MPRILLNFEFLEWDIFPSWGLVDHYWNDYKYEPIEDNITRCCSYFSWLFITLTFIKKYD